MVNQKFTYLRGYNSTRVTTRREEQNGSIAELVGVVAAENYRPSLGYVVSTDDGNVLEELLVAELHELPEPVVGAAPVGRLFI